MATITLYAAENPGLSGDWNDVNVFMNNAAYPLTITSNVNYTVPHGTFNIRWSSSSPSIISLWLSTTKYLEFTLSGNYYVCTFDKDSRASVLNQMRLVANAAVVVPNQQPTVVRATYTQNGTSYRVAVEVAEPYSATNTAHRILVSGSYYIANLFTRARLANGNTVYVSNVISGTALVSQQVSIRKSLVYHSSNRVTYTNFGAAFVNITHGTNVVNTVTNMVTQTYGAGIDTRHMTHIILTKGTGTEVIGTYPVTSSGTGNVNFSFTRPLGYGNMDGVALTSTGALSIPHFGVNISVNTPASLNPTAQGYAGITLSIAAPSILYGFNLTKYTVRATNNFDATVQNIDVPVTNNSGITYVFPYNYLVSGRGYKFTASATTTDTTSGFTSTPVNFITYTIAAPPEPTITNASGGISNGTITFTSSPTSAITSFNVYNASNNSLLGSGSSSPLIISGLTKNTSYTVYVKAVNSAGESIASNSSSFVAIGVPEVPTEVSVVASDGQAVITFTAPVNNGGSSITRYNVYNVSNDVLLSYGASSPITVVGLTNDTSYSVYVTAVNAAGEGSQSADSALFTPSGTPICFFGNAPVLTPSGYKRMDSIKVGDLVLSDKGKQVRVKHVELTLCAASKQNNPYVIEAGQFGATERVLISPAHRVSTNGKMVKAKDLGLEREEMEGVLHYYNLQLENWSNMVVAGVKVESLAPIQRTVVTVPQLVSILQAKYGSDMTTKEITNKVLRTCRLMADGRVEVPILRTK
jgi:hypothetical protein